MTNPRLTHPCPVGHQIVKDPCCYCNAKPRHKSYVPVVHPRGQYKHHHINEFGVANAEDRAMTAAWSARRKTEFNESQILLAAARMRVAQARARGEKVVVR